MKKKKPLLKELTVEERNIILPMLIKFLEKRTNDKVHITADRIIEWFHYKKEKIGFKSAFNLQRLMKLTNYIRVNSLTSLISTNDGYYVSDDEEIIEEIISSLDGRIESVSAARDGMKYRLTQIRVEKSKKGSPDILGFTWD